MSKGVIFDKKNILIIGGAGFVGSHLCDELVKSNKVICLDNFLTGRQSNISHLLQSQDFIFINHDIINSLDLVKQPELSGFKIEFQGLQEIYFLASPTSPQDYQKYPLETLLVNSVGLRHALDLAVKYQSKFFYASSPAVYGQTQKIKAVKEDYLGAVNQLGLRACFEEAKRFGETLVNNYRLRHGLNTKIARIANCYGPRLRLADGRMIPEIIRLALKNEAIIIYGDKNSHGSYFFISDLIKGITKLMESGENGPMNLGSEWKNKFAEIAQKIIAISGSKSEIKFAPVGELMSTQPLVDIDLAKAKLGWFPVVLLDEGLTKTIDYLSAQQGILAADEFSEKVL